MNVELAHKLTEQEEHAEKRKERWHEAVEIFEVALLAIVAIATAWSGLQATRWEGRQSLLDSHATSVRFKADESSTRGGQQLAADSAMFTGWLQAHAVGDTELENIFVRRFTADYRSAFDAWLTTDPFVDAQAPPGPAYMPGYHNPDVVQAKLLNEQATATLHRGVKARETADKYVRDTVLFASVLFLVAIAQRFKARGIRIGATLAAFALLVFVLASVSQLPRL